MLQDSATLSRYPVRSGSVSGHLGRPLVDLLPCAQERHRQDARMCRPAEAQRVHKYEHFKMEGLHTVAQMLRRNDYMTKIDISDFYHHFLLQQQDSRYMRFMWEGVKYECIGMPFGLAPAPRFATKLLAPVIRHLRRLGLRVPVYIDDIICLARSITRSIAHTQVAVDTLHYLGFSVHPEKCNLIPLRSQEFLGTQVNSKKMQFRVAREKIRNIRREIQAVFKANDLHQLTVRNLASLLGKLNALQGAVVLA